MSSCVSDPIGQQTFRAQFSRTGITISGDASIVRGTQLRISDGELSYEPELFQLGDSFSFDFNWKPGTRYTISYMSNNTTHERQIEAPVLPSLAVARR